MRKPNKMVFGKNCHGIILSVRHKVGQHYCIFESNPPLRDKREREFGGHAFHVFFAKRTRVLKGLLYCFFYISGYRHLELQVHYSRSSPGKRVKPELKIQELFI